MLRYFLKLFFLSQLILFLAWFLAEKFVPIGTEAFLGRSSAEPSSSSLVWSRANFDGVHHISIARSGYGYLQQTFFPFYAKTISFFRPLFNNFTLSGIFVSTASFVFCLIILADLFKTSGEKEETVKKSLLFLTVFPTSFYFFFVYSESLFLLLVLLSFWLAGKKRWFWSGLIAGLASYTRLAGIFLLPALLYEYYQSESKRRMPTRITAVKKDFVSKINFKYLVHLLKTRGFHFKNLFFLSFSSWGLFLYMNFLGESKGDPFYFIKIQPSFGAQKSVTKVIMIYQVFWRYLKMIFTVNPNSLTYFNVWLELLTVSLFLYLLIVGWFKVKIRRSWMIFSGLAFVLPSLTGTFSSMPRYVLVCFPCFLILAKMKLPQKLFLFSGLALLVLSGLFIRGFWIA